MKIKKIKSKIWIDDYTIKFEYETKRGNHKAQKRMITTTDKKLAERDFWLWINTMSEDEPHRAMLNVNILSIERGEGRYISL
ncbi:hypothetical protein [uncultured Clostridium sp.]|uniref:hypothetical protein n=1 Tax=uncultured Clostridium sp. TaxID=59620 RepID=UPI002583E640|nr:hypothetical protein [uncultured Clostridium sp.]MDU1348293.1 hypothetical protein [Clostridium argentinense]